MTTATLTETSYFNAFIEFRTLLEEKGKSETITQWCEKPFTAWLESIEQGEDLTTLDDRIRLIVAMSVGNEARDALLISMLNNPKARQLDTLLFIAANSTNDENKQLTHQLLNEGMNDPEQLAHERIQTITNILMHMCDDITAANIPRALAQPLATLAYVQYWTGQTLAAKNTAKTAMQANPSNSLAHLVYKMIQTKITPRAYQN